MPQASHGAPNNSLKLTRRAGASGWLVRPLACRTIKRVLPASAGQLSSRPLGRPMRRPPVDADLSSDPELLKARLRECRRALKEVEVATRDSLSC